MKFRVKSIRFFFFKFPFTTSSRGIYDDKLKASCELFEFIETLMSRAAEGEKTENLAGRS